MTWSRSSGPGPKAEQLAEEARTRLLDQVDQKRQPHTNAGYARKHIRPLIGTVEVGALEARTFDSFYAELRRCRDHCGRKRWIDHRPTQPHECAERCRPHPCKPFGDAMIR